jgi:hypothetical protein
MNMCVRVCVVVMSQGGVCMGDTPVPVGAHPLHDRDLFVCLCVTVGVLARPDALIRLQSGKR